MSLTVNANSASTIAPITEGTHLGVCNMLIDLGMQYNEAYKTTSRKVLVGWEIPDETIELDGGPVPRNISKTYTASLNDSANLRQDLAAWRGRDFTAEELAGFDLHKIVGTSCLLNVIHKESNGKTYANISSIMALPKGMPKGQLSEPPVVFDLDTDDLKVVDNFPKWIAERIYKSQTYQDRLTAKAPVIAELPGQDDGELPF